MIANDCSSGAKFQGCCHSASGPLGLTFPVTRCTITEIAGHVGGVRHQSRFRGARSATQQTDADGAADGRRQGTPRSWRDAERPRLRSVAVVGCALGVEVQSAGLLEMVCVEAVECGCSLQMFAESSLQVLPCPGLGLLRLRAVEAAPLPCCLAVADVKSEKKGAGRCTGSRGEDARKPHADTGPCRGPQCDRRSSVRCAALRCAVLCCLEGRSPRSALDFLVSILLGTEPEPEAQRDALSALFALRVSPRSSLEAGFAGAPCIHRGVGRSGEPAVPQCQCAPAGSPDDRGKQR